MCSYVAFESSRAHLSTFITLRDHFLPLNGLGWTGLWTGLVAHVEAKIEELVAQGKPPAAFIAEPLSGNAGGVELPRG